jgi:acyl-CoA reductase-like NAD-dependent aldehyde dehydrogenase
MNSSAGSELIFCCLLAVLYFVFFPGEIFGPFLPVIEVSDVNEAIAFIKSRPKPLAAHFFGSAEGENKELFARRTSSGGLCINDSIGHFASQELPFGGVGYSGCGAVHGKYGFDQLCHMKPVLERSCDNSGSAMLRFPPYGPDRLKELGITQ